jgi:hypothetical protein
MILLDGEMDVSKGEGGKASKARRTKDKEGEDGRMEEVEGRRRTDKSPRTGSRGRRNEGRGERKGRRTEYRRGERDGMRRKGGEEGQGGKEGDKSKDKRDTYVCAADPTRDTDRPTLMAGRTPRKKSSASKKIWPSVMEMTCSIVSYQQEQVIKKARRQGRVRREENPR